MSLWIVIWILISQAKAGSNSLIPILPLGPSPWRAAQSQPSGLISVTVMDLWGLPFRDVPGRALEVHGRSSASWVRTQPSRSLAPLGSREMVFCSLGLYLAYFQSKRFLPAFLRVASVLTRLHLRVQRRTLKPSAGPVAPWASRLAALSFSALSCKMEVKAPRPPHDVWMARMHRIWVHLLRCRILKP